MHNLVAVAYVISGILFITALRGLSSPESSRRGNILGIIGMFIAVAATLVSVDFFNSDILTITLAITAITVHCELQLADRPGGWRCHVRDRRAIPPRPAS